LNNKIGKVTSGLFWTYAERILAQFITILVTIVLSRLISPDEYGLIAIVNVFITIANAFVINGFGNSLIQKKDSDDTDFSTVFYFSLAFSLGIYLLIFFGAPYIASFYNMSELTLVTRIMGIKIPIAAINSIQQAYISKRMEFKKFFFATLVGTIFSAFFGIFLAYRGFGIWALVGQYLSNSCIDTIMLSFTSGWKPKFLYSRKRMKSLFSYGWKIMAVGVMSTLYSSLRNLIIGKKYTSADLAYSEKGEQFPSAIAGNINSSITKVLFPVLSDSQGDVDQLKRMVRRSIKIGCYVLFPLLFGFCMISEPFVRIVLTDRWIGCVPFLQIMCITYALQPMQTSSLQCVKATGKSGLYLSIDLIKKALGLVILFVTVLCFNDVLVIVLGALITEIASVLVLVPVNIKIINYSLREQVLDILPIVALTTIMCASVFCISLLNIQSFVVQLLLQIFAGAFVYIFLSKITSNENYLYIKKIVVSRFSK